MVMTYKPGARVTFRVSNKWLHEALEAEVFSIVNARRPRLGLGRISQTTRKQRLKPLKRQVEMRACRFNATGVDAPPQST
jgi:hypothetical protein